MLNFRLLTIVLSLVPNPAVTPGVVRPLTVVQVCTIKWGLDARHVTVGMKQEIAANYGLTLAEISGKGLCCVYDHLIPRQLAGADAVGNIWVQPWASAHAKDVEENRLHRAVCAGTLALVDAQRIMRGWGQR